MELKIGRHTYEITSEDIFLDNGACVQLLTQSKERSDWGRIPNPVLSKKAIKELKEYGVSESQSEYKKCVEYRIK